MQDADGRLVVDSNVALILWTFHPKVGCWMFVHRDWEGRSVAFPTPVKR